MSYDLMFAEAHRLYADGALKQAEDIYRQILQINPHNPDVLNMLGLIAHQKFMFAEAQDFFYQALRISPHHLPLYFNLAVSLQADNKLCEAENAYRQVLRLNPNLKEAWNNLGGVYEALQLPDKARQCYLEALKADADYLEAAVNLAVLDNDTQTLQQLTAKNSENPLPYTVKGWMLDNTNKHSYLVRQLDNSWFGYAAGADNRFVSSQAVAAGLYRTHWGIDPNYDTFAAPSSENGLNTVEGTAPALETKTDTTYYCLENTFNTANQTYQSTTRAVVKVVFNGGHDFFLLNDDKTVLYEQGTGKTHPLENLVAHALISEPTLNAKIKQSLNAGKTFGEGDVASLTLSAPDTKGISKVTGVTLSTSDAGKYRTELTFTPSDLDKLNTQLGTLYKYVNGTAYYAVKIRHFADAQTPVPALGYTEKEHLGRYGVLRNNWYQLTINSVKLVGAPVVPLVSGNTSPDDTDEQYISVGIKVLSWAVRTQQVDLQ